MGASILALIGVLVTRILGPSDLWDKAQPKTVSYTTDIIVHGGDRWILPLERDTNAATKPPLYNWIAVPMVHLLGFSSEIAHKFPSVLSVCVCWLIVVRIGREQFGDKIGWMAGLCFVTNSTIFKLGYLARPDMLLVLWVLLAWFASTRLLLETQPGSVVNERRVTLDRIIFWTAIALAGLTKGPILFIPLLYAVIASRMIGGSFRAFNVMRWWWGGPFVIIVCGAWVYGVWRINPEHLFGVLWKGELVDRFTGDKFDINDYGTWGWFKTLPFMSVYFLARFLPWSPFAIFSMMRVWSRHSEIQRPIGHGDAESRETKEQWRWLFAASILIVLTIIIFSLSMGKRADYLAICYPQAAILAAWGIQTGWTFKSRVAIGIAPTLASLTFAIMVWVNLDQSKAPSPDFARGITRFIDECTAEIKTDPLPIPCCWMGTTQLQAMLGLSQGPELIKAGDLIRAGQSFRVFLAWRALKPKEYMDRIHQAYPEVKVEEVVRSEDLPFAKGWVGRISMYQITPLAPEHAP